MDGESGGFAFGDIQVTVATGNDDGRWWLVVVDADIHIFIVGVDAAGGADGEFDILVLAVGILLCGDGDGLRRAVVGGGEGQGGGGGGDGTGIGARYRYGDIGIGLGIEFDGEGAVIAAFVEGQGRRAYFDIARGLFRWRNDCGAACPAVTDGDAVAALKAGCSLPHCIFRTQHKSFWVGIRRGEAARSILLMPIRYLSLPGGCLIVTACATSLSTCYKYPIVTGDFVAPEGVYDGTRVPVVVYAYMHVRLRDYD